MLFQSKTISKHPTPKHNACLFPTNFKVCDKLSDESTTHLPYPQTQNSSQLMRFDQTCGCPVSDPIKILDSTTRRYNSSQKYFYLQAIEDILTHLKQSENQSEKDVKKDACDNKTMRFVNKVKDAMLFDSAQANLKTFVKLRHYPTTLKKQAEYFRYYKDLPKIYLNKVSKILRDHYYDHQYILYRRVNACTEAQAAKASAKQQKTKAEIDNNNRRKYNYRKVSENSSASKILKQLTKQYNEVAGSNNTSLISLKQHLEILLPERNTSHYRVQSGSINSKFPLDIKMAPREFQKTKSLKRFLTEDITGCSSIRQQPQDKCMSPDMQFETPDEKPRKKIIKNYRNNLLRTQCIEQNYEFSNSPNTRQSEIFMRLVNYPSSYPIQELRVQTPILKGKNSRILYSEQSGGPQLSQNTIKHVKSAGSLAKSLLRKSSDIKQMKCFSNDRRSNHKKKASSPRPAFLKVSESSDQKPTNDGHNRLKTTFNPKRSSSKNRLQTIHAMQNLRYSACTLTTGPADTVVKKHTRMSSDCPLSKKTLATRASGCSDIVPLQLVLEVDGPGSKHIQRRQNRSQYRMSKSPQKIALNTNHFYNNNVIGSGIQEAIKKLSVSNKGKLASEYNFKKKKQ